MELLEKMLFFFSKIAKPLQDAGFDKDFVQCWAKVKNLKMPYNKVKDNYARSGRERIVCPHFELLDAIVHAQSSTEPSEVIEALSDDAGNHSDASDALNQNEAEQNESEEEDHAGEQNEVESGRDDEEQASGGKQPPAKK